MRKLRLFTPESCTADAMVDWINKWAEKEGHTIEDFKPYGDSGIIVLYTEPEYEKKKHWTDSAK